MAAFEWGGFKNEFGFHEAGLLIERCHGRGLR
jgi:hypothetical protein